MADKNAVGSTLGFVIARGFTQVGRYPALLGFDGSQRLFAELFADVDRPDVQPAGAYYKLITNLQAGQTIRIMQIYWPDSEPRTAFLQRLEGWENHKTEGQDILYQGLSLAAQQLPLPFLRRTFIEYVCQGEGGLAWWEGLPDSCASYGVQAKYLGAREIQELAYRILNPGFDQYAKPETGDGSGIMHSTKSEAADEYRRSVAPAGLELAEDYLIFPDAILLPISARGGGIIPGMAGRPWSSIEAKTFIGSAPAIYSLTIHREPPNTVGAELRARRTLAEGVMNVLAEKTGRRPSMAEMAQDSAMDSAESRARLGDAVFRVSLLSTLFTTRSELEIAIAARSQVESSLKGAGLTPLKLHLIPERALLHLQPGGNLFPGFMDRPRLFYKELEKLIPLPSRRVMPARDAVWIGLKLNEGRDVHLSYTAGLDPNAPPPPHALTLILGDSGAGKTTLLRLIMLQRLMQGRTILSIDPEGENNKLCEAMGGTVIPAGAPEDPDTCLLHPLQAESPQDMLLAARFLMATLTGQEGMTPGIQAVLHEAVKRRWERTPGNMSIADLVDTLGTLNDPNAANPMSFLRPYMYGGLWDGFFDRPKTLLGTELAAGQWMNFDLSTLSSENIGIIHAVLSWFLYHVVTVGKTAMDIYIDEGWRLLRSGPFADLLDELGRRARKRNIGVTLITHMPKELAENPTSLNMASTVFIGKTQPDEAFAFFQSMGVPQAEARQNAGEVSRLLKKIFMAVPSGGRGALFPVLVTIPPVWLEFLEKLGAIQTEHLE